MDPTVDRHGGLLIVGTTTTKRRRRPRAFSIGLFLFNHKAKRREHHHPKRGRSTGAVNDRELQERGPVGSHSAEERPREARQVEIAETQSGERRSKWQCGRGRLVIGHSKNRSEGMQTCGHGEEGQGQRLDVDRLRGRRLHGWRSRCVQDPFQGVASTSDQGGARIRSASAIIRLPTSQLYRALPKLCETGVIPSCRRTFVVVSLPTRTAPTVAGLTARTSTFPTQR